VIEQPTNDETYRTVRSRVLDDLRDKFRRARSDTPVIGIEDIALLRNVVRPALDQTKIGQAAREFLADGPLLPLLLKLAGDGSDYLSSQMGEASGAFGDLNSAPGFITPDMAKQLQGFGKEQGTAVPTSIASRAAETPAPDQSWWQKGIGGAMSVFDALAAPGKALYNVGQGLAGGALGGVSSDALDWSKENLKPVDRAAEWVAGDLPVALATGGTSALASGGKLLGSVAAAGAKKAIPSLASAVGRDAMISTVAPAALAGGMALGQGASLGQAGQIAGQNVALPWAEEAAPAATSVAQDVAPTIPKSFDMSSLFNQNYWGGGMSPLVARGFSDQIGGLLKSFDPSMLGGLGSR
jgi:hypothetical protein